jgi:hypothetical protein
MKTVQKKYSDLVLSINIINAIIGGQETKIQKKLQKFYEKALKPHHDSYNEQAEELRLDNAATDDKGVLLLDEKGGYRYNKEGRKKLEQDFKKLSEKEFDYNLIDVVNPQGLEEFTFLKDWTNGIDFVEAVVEEEEEL